MKVTDQTIVNFGATIRAAFSDLGDRIAGGASSENVAVPLMAIAKNLGHIETMALATERLAEAVERLAQAQRE